MTKIIRASSVKGGFVARDAKTGRFLSVKTGQKTSNAGRISELVVGRTTSKRKDALERLVDR